MITFSTDVYAKVSTQEYVAVEHDGVMIVASEVGTGEESYDCCGYAVQDWQGEWKSNCRFCDEELKDITNRIDEALYWADDPAKAIAKIADRTGVSVVVVEDRAGYGYNAVPLTEHTEIGSYDRLIVTPYDAMAYAKEFIAVVSGKTWTVGALPVDEFDPETFDFYGECANICHGYVWQNVDSQGDSSPTEHELVNVF